MSDAEFLKELAEYERPYRRMDFEPGDPGAVPVTKLSGVPWWPEGTERPTCVDEHLMAFMAQIRLDEVPGFDQPPTLLSFHYCQQCLCDGKMAFGWQDRGKQLRYRVSLFSDLESTPVDGLGIMEKSDVSPQIPSFHDGIETMGYEDVSENFPDRQMPDLGKFFNEDRSKLGGWPSWVQHPFRPEDEMGNEMDFVCQLDMWSCPNSVWNCGAAFLFASEYNEDEQEAEFILQTT